MRAFPLPFLTSAVLLMAAAGCDLGETATREGDLASVVAEVRSLDSFSDAAEAAGLLEELAGSGPLTVFAPNEVAFTYLGEARARLLDPEFRPLLLRILRHHIVPGDLGPDDLADGATLPTLDGSTLRVRRLGGRIYVGDAEVDTVAYRATNGRVYEVRSVLRAHLPTHDRLRLSPTADAFVEMIDRAGLTPTLQGDPPLTVFVPVDDGYRRVGPQAIGLLYSAQNAALLGRLARFHLVPGRIPALTGDTTLVTLEGSPLEVTRVDGQVYVGGERVLTAPVETADGVIYLVARPLLTTLTLDERLRIEPELTDFSAFVRRIPSLTAALAGDAPYTIFAPNNASFSDDLPLATRQVITDPENAALFERLIGAHIVPGRVTTADLHDGDVLTTLAGTTLPVLVREGAYFVDGRQIYEGDFPARNGVLHRILGVIKPPSDLVDSALLFGFTNFVASVRRAGMEAELRASTPRTLFAFTNVAYARNSGLFTAPNIRAIIEYHLFDGVLDPLTVGPITPVSGPPRLITDNPDPRGTDFLIDGLPATAYGPMTNGYLYAVDEALYPPAPLAFGPR